MIAVDTNILLRHFLEDDVEQTERARRFLRDERRRAEPAWVSHVVLAELAWVLRQRLGIGSKQIALAIRHLLDSEGVVVERADVVESALAMDLPDLADALIHAMGKASGCSKTITFDERFARQAGVFAPV